MTTSNRIRSRGEGTLFQRHGRGPWIAAWHDHNGKRHQKSTGTTDKAAARRILAKAASDAALRKSGVIDARAEAVAVQSRRPIEQQVSDWEASLDAKGNSIKRARTATSRVRKVIDRCGIECLADFEASKVQKWIMGRREAGNAPRTINGYLQALKQFTKWAVGERRLAHEPLAGVHPVKVVGQTFTRRPLSPEELFELIDSTSRASTRRGMTGEDRAALYRVAVGTGFRAAELKSLTSGCFQLEDSPPAIIVIAANSKRRRDDRQPIRQELADFIRPRVQATARGEAVLRVCDLAKLASVLREDLRRARAAWLRKARDPSVRRERRGSDFLRVEDVQGRRVDFHALRATYITMLVMSGASVKEAQELARHSDPKLTMNVYTKLGIHDLGAALDRMPTIRPPASDPNETATMAATGTLGVKVHTPEAQQYRQQFGRETTRDSAARCDGIGKPKAHAGDAKPLPLNAQGDSVRADAGEDGKATYWTRTSDLSFTKAPLYQLS